MYVFFLTSFITMAALGLFIIRPFEMPNWMDDNDRFVTEAVLFVSILLGMFASYIV